ncbi:MAG: hypothetical protein D4S01_04240 [Dehalococcoidia bacterium]|nr:MAG: hypothetical protein D4S01_04240 [Dehalococcoidia bacterium]
MPKPKGIFVLSGKGGVGKTLIAVNVCLHLKDKGLKVGLLDADFSASNSGYFLDLSGKSMGLSREEFHPVECDGIEVFSIPLVLGENSVSMIGDQYSQLFRDAVEAASWNAEYIVVDLPAGFGDELKAAARVFSESLLGSIIVVQPAHHLDARRALQLHKDLEMPVLGLIENMSYLKVGKAEWKIFGESVVDQLGEEYGVTVFGKIPLSMKIRKQIEQKNPKLTGEYADPVEKAVDAILHAQPKKPGFLKRIKNAVKEHVDKLIIGLALSINKELSIPDIQKRFGYPGGSIIRLNIMDESMEKIIAQADWIVHEGKLTIAEGQYYSVDAQIDITTQAIKWTILGNKQMSDGHMYNFKDAQRLDHMRVYGDRSMAKSAFFMRHVFESLSKNEGAMSRMRPLLEVL